MMPKSVAYKVRDTAAPLQSNQSVGALDPEYMVMAPTGSPAGLVPVGPVGPATVDAAPVGPVGPVTVEASPWRP